MTFSSTPEIEARPRDVAQPAQARPSRPQFAARAVRLAAALAGLAAICGYLFVALNRIGYPFAINPLEGNSLVEVHRILAGQPLYPAPTSGYVPDGYTPLYFYVAAAVARVLGVSYLPLRLVSLLSSLVCFALLGRLVQRETGSIAAGTGAAGLFAATYFVTGTWFDVGRVDSLFLALSIGGLYAVRRMTSTRGAIVAGVVLAAAALTKQTGLAEGVAVVAVLLIGPRARLGRVAALAEFAVFGISTLVFRLTSGGWYTYYVFKQMSEHSLTTSNFGWFCSALLTAMGLAACAAVIAARRVPRELLAGCAALAIEGLAALVHSGGTLNDVQPAYLAVALLAGLALGGNSVRWGPFTRLGPFTWSGTVVSGVLVIAQSVILLASFHPSQAIPTSAARAAGERLVAGMRAFGGDVADSADPSLTLMAGMAPAAHPGAVYDVLRATDRGAIVSFRRSAEEAVTARQFSAFIGNSPGEPLYGPSNISQDYQECVQSVPTLLVPAPGGHAVPAIIWIPRGSMSCQAAINILAGGKATRS